MSTQKQSIDEKMDLILQELSALRSDVDILKGSCGRMDNHIGFIERVYTNIRGPISWVLNRLSSSQVGLPAIEHIEEDIEEVD